MEAAAKGKLKKSFFRLREMMFPHPAGSCRYHPEERESCRRHCKGKAKKRFFNLSREAAAGVEAAAKEKPENHFFRLR